ALITGKIGSPRNGIIVVTPGANHLGLWNLGITACGCKQIEALQQGTLKGMFIFGEDPVGAGSLTAEELKATELLVVATPFMTPTAELAEVIFPASTPVEVNGTYIAADRKVREVSSVLNPAGGKNNEEIISDLAGAMSVNLADYKSQGIKDSITVAEQAIYMAQVQVQLLMPECTELFKPAPIQNPALKKFNDKLGREGLK
ncbi:MAG: molybdopterin-dependent oxidoreductase, partial [Syntrophomonadaceae bacterium]